MKKVALITGASTGIGRELAKIHAEEGGDLVIISRNEGKLNQLKQELEKQYHIKVEVIAKDLSNINAPKEIYKEVKEKGIEIDYLINNAGFGALGKFHELDLDLQISMINLNITALTALTHLFLKDFVKINSGKILNTSSTASFMPGPLQAVYFATKAYVTFFSNALSEELHDTNITVTNLMPGATESEFGATSGMDKTEMFQKPVSAYSVAIDGYNGMLKGKIDVVSGLTTMQKIMMAMIPFTPKKMLLKQIHKMQEVKMIKILLLIVKKMMITIFSILLLFTLIGITFINLSSQFGGKPSELSVERINKSPNFINGAFKNQQKTLQSTGFKWKTIPQFFTDGNNKTPKKELPYIPLSKEFFNHKPQQPRITWFGHSALFVEMEGMNIFIDPMLGEVPAPHPLLGNERFNKEIPISIENLPKNRFGVNIS